MPPNQREAKIPNTIDRAFWGCSKLEKFIVDADNTAYSSRDGILYDKTQTQIILAPEAIQGAITIPDGVISIGDYAFEGCGGLTSVTIPNSVTSIGSCAFGNCSGLTSVTIPNSVTSIGSWAFGNCSGLTSVTIGSGVTSIGDYAFEGCGGLTSVTIGSNVISIGDYAFKGCGGLTSVTIPNSVTSIGDGAFQNCSGLTEIHYNGTIEAWKKVEKGVSFDFMRNYTIYCTDGEIAEDGTETRYENSIQ